MILKPRTMDESKIYDLMAVEEAGFLMMRSNGTARLVPDGLTASLQAKLTSFVTSMVQGMKELHAKKDTDLQAYQAGIEACARKLLVECKFKSDWLGHIGSVGIEAFKGAIGSLGEDPKKLIEFLFPELPVGVERHAEQRLHLACRLCDALLDDVDGMAERQRVLQQKVSRRTKNLLAELQQAMLCRSYLHAIEMMLLLTTSNSRFDAFAMHDLKARFFKDFSRNPVFKGVIFAAYFVEDHDSEGILIRLLIVADPTVSGESAYLTQAIGQFWSQSVTSGHGFSLADVQPQLQGGAPGPSLISTADTRATGHVRERIEYICSRIACRSIRHGEGYTSFGIRRTSPRDWEKMAAQQAVLMPPPPVIPGFNDHQAQQGHDEALDSDQSIAIPLGLDKESLRSVCHRLTPLGNNNMLLAGPPGSGKSQELLNYISCLIRAGVPVIHVDPHDEGGILGLPTFVVSHGSVDVVGVEAFGIGPSDLELKGIDGVIAENIELINSCVGNALGHREKAILAEVFKHLFDEEGLGEGAAEDAIKSPKPIQVIQALEMLANSPGRKSELKSIKGAKAAVQSAFGGKAFNQETCLGRRDLVDGASKRIVISHLPPKDQAIIVEVILRSILNQLVDMGMAPHPSSSDRDIARVVVVVDEANTLNQIGSMDAKGRAPDAFVRQSRKYAGALVLCSQSFADFGDGIRKQVPAWMAFRQIDNVEASSIAKKFNIRPEAVMGLKTAEEAYFWDGKSVSARCVRLPPPLQSVILQEREEEESLIPKDFKESLV
jgi:hypothetical protein